MDDAIGTVRPDDPTVYTMRLAADGSVAMRLDCDQVTGTWSAEPSADPASGRLVFGPLAATRAVCPPPSLGESIAAHSAFVRSYLLKDDRLALGLMANGGIYLWKRQAQWPSGGGARLPVASRPRASGRRRSSRARCLRRSVPTAQRPPSRRSAGRPLRTPRRPAPA
jgi:hypothetical protein